MTRPDLIVSIVTISRTVSCQTGGNDLHAAAAQVRLREDGVQIVSRFPPAGLDTLDPRQHPAIALLVNGVRLKSLEKLQSYSHQSVRENSPSRNLRIFRATDDIVSLLHLTNL